MKLIVDYDDGSQETLDMADLGIEPDGLDDEELARRVLDALANGIVETIGVAIDHGDDYRDGWDSVDTKEE